MTGLESIVAKTPAKINIPTHQVVGQRKVAVPKPDGWCGGWHVYGTTAEKQATHLAYRQRVIEGARERGEKVPFIPKLKSYKLSPKPFAIESSADEFLELHRKNGTIMLMKKQLLPSGKVKQV